MEHQVIEWVARYGYAAIFCLLVLGIVGLPVPDETLLTFTGYLVFKGDLKLPPAFASAFLGSACGITLSYTLGRIFGIALIHRYGSRIHISEKEVNRAHAWFERVGRWGLMFGYFVPGVRHLTAYAAGMSRLETGQFALFAYSGALAWAATFLTLGYFLGERWQPISAAIERYASVLALAAVIAAGVFLFWRVRRK
jgi:membrane protein DedA with SNARE-associated domain